MRRKFACPICGKKTLEVVYDKCSYCGWICDGMEKNYADSYNNPNGMTPRKAKQMVADGMNIQGGVLIEVESN